MGNHRRRNKPYEVAADVVREREEKERLAVTDGRREEFVI
jgi:hypothetical protein